MEFVAYLLNIATPQSLHIKDHILKLSPCAVVTPELLFLLHDCRLLRVRDVRCEHVYPDRRMCSQIMELRVSTLYRQDGHALVCPTHGVHVSIRRGSWFQGRRLRLTQLLYILHLLKCRTAIHSIRDFFESAKVNRSTIAGVLTELQARMWRVLKERHMPVFDPSDELEIDEMWLTWQHWDDNVDTETREQAWKQGKWVVGLVNRAHTKLWIECVPDRRRETIAKVVNPLLKQWLLRWPRIHTDALKSYEYLKAENTHYIINKARDGFCVKQRTFWGKEVSVSVNQIEGVWKHLRAHLSMRSAYRTPKLAQLYIAEFMYNWYKLDWWSLVQLP
jgi:ISXO2-like transposase domain